MKHIVILDDTNLQNKAFLQLAKSLSNIKILTAKQWEAIEDNFIANEIKAGLKTPVASQAEVKKALQKMRGK